MLRKEKQVEELNRKLTIAETHQCVLGETGNKILCNKRILLSEMFVSLQACGPCVSAWLRGTSGAADPSLCPAAFSMASVIPAAEPGPVIPATELG